jgi:ribosome-associated protein
MDRLVDLIRRAAVRPIPRRKTRPPKSSRRERLESKRRRSETKSLRKVRSFD